MPIRAVVFDIGGVLEYTPRLGVDEKWERKLGLKKDEMGARLMDMWEAGSYGRISLEDVHRTIGERLGMSIPDVHAYMEDVWTEYVGTLNIELVEYFRSLRPRYKTGILSNSFVGAREREIAAYHFDEMTDMIIYSHEEHLYKPDPAFYELTCQRLGVEPAEMIFLDDAPPNIEGALAFGIHGVLFKNNAQAIAEIEALLAQ